jgi:MFS family permease
LAAVVQGSSLHHLLPILSERELHPDVAVMAISFIGPMQVAGRLTMIAAERRVSIHGIAIACFVLIGLSIVLLIGAGVTPAMLIGFVILFGGAYGVVSIIRPVIARNLLGERLFGSKSGALALIYLVGSASAPFLGALVWSRGGYNLVLPGLVGLAGIGLVLYMLAHRIVLKKQHE